MALKQTWGWKFRPELDYMTTAERTYFKELVQAGAITIFKMGTCASKECQKDVPEIKTYCSLACKEQTENSDEKNV